MRPLDEELLDLHDYGGETVSFFNLLGKNIYQSQSHIDLWISLHDSDSGLVGPDKGPFNRRRTPLCRSGAAVVNARANGVLQILSQPMSMEVVTGQRSKRCCTLHGEVPNFCTIP